MHDENFEQSILDILSEHSKPIICFKEENFFFELEKELCGVLDVGIIEVVMSCIVKYSEHVADINFKEGMKCLYKLKCELSNK